MRLSQGCTALMGLMECRWWGLMLKCFALGLWQFPWGLFGLLSLIDFFMPWMLKAVAALNFGACLWRLLWLCLLCFGWVGLCLGALALALCGAFPDAKVNPLAALLIGLLFHFDWRVLALGWACLLWVGALGGFGACLGALLWLCGLWLGWACSCLGGLALACLGACFGLGGLGFALGGALLCLGWGFALPWVWAWACPCPLGVKGRKGRAGLFFAFIVVWVGGLRFFMARLVGWSWLVFFAFPRALRGWGEKTLSSWSRQGS